MAGSYLLPHFPQAEQTMEQVAAPQQLPATPKIYRRHRVSVLALCWVRQWCRAAEERRTVPMLGTAISGIERSAPMMEDGRQEGVRKSDGVDDREGSLGSRWDGVVFERLRVSLIRLSGGDGGTGMDGVARFGCGCV